MKKIVFLVSILLGFLFAQEVPYISGKTTGNQVANQKILFQQSYTNWAWGYINEGWFVDSTGQFFSYLIQNPDNWYHIESHLYVSEDELYHNFHLATQMSSFVNKDTLIVMSSLIDSAVTGVISERISVGADMGSLRNICFWWDPDSDKYKQILLSEWGDWVCYNTDSSAIVLASWLKNISKIAGIDINDEEKLIPDYHLTNYPNPFNANTFIKYSIPEETSVVLKIFNYRGQEVCTLVNEVQKENEYYILFDGHSLPSGVYFYRLGIGNNTHLTQKMLLIK